MATTLSYGYQLPQTGDKGASLFSALESNITQVNAHTHDGMNSAPIQAFAIQGSQSQILPAAWTSFGGAVGEYRQTVTMAAGYTYDKNTMSFRTLAGDYVYPTVKKVDQTTFTVTVNDPTLTLVVVYGG